MNVLEAKCLHQQCNPNKWTSTTMKLTRWIYASHSYMPICNLRLPRWVHQQAFQWKLLEFHGPPRLSFSAGKVGAKSGRFVPLWAAQGCQPARRASKLAHSSYSSLATLMGSCLSLSILKVNLLMDPPKGKVKEERVCFQMQFNGNQLTKHIKNNLLLGEIFN